MKNWEELQAMSFSGGNSVNSTKLAVAKLSTVIADIKDSGHGFDKQQKLVHEARAKAMGDMVPFVNQAREAANVAASQREFLQSKAYLASVATFKDAVGISSNAQVRATLAAEFAKMPAALLALTLKAARSNNDLATAYQVYRAVNERSNEKGLADEIGRDVFDGFHFEGRDKGLAAIDQCVANARSAEHQFGIASGRIKETGSASAINVARAQNEAVSQVALAEAGISNKDL